MTTANLMHLRNAWSVRVVLALALGSWLVDSHTAMGAAEPNDTVQFNRDIRPILSDYCFQCHGPDKNQRKADLRLDLESGALAVRDGHAAVVPGDPQESELYRRISTDDEDDRMPPAKTGRQLSPNEIALLKQWIEQGAKWEAHWAYLPPARPPVPVVKNSQWPKSPVDFFILSNLESQGLTPSPEADRRTLIRRLSFDLTGLPPTPDEVDAFIQDTASNAYERVVDRLLASPHYGERMAVHWLDLVRYADTDGFHADNYRSVYPYRDYVISAFNRNMPFDQFTIEQIAGDLLPNATQEQKIASTYNRLNRTTEEGGSQAKEYLAKYAADRVRTTATIWLGATLGCAECHDHKFDPYTTRDFYTFAAFFADIKEQGVGKPEGIPLPNDEQKAELARLDARILALEEQMHDTTNRLFAVQSAWEEKLRADLDAGHLDWLLLKPYVPANAPDAALQLQPDLSVAASGDTPNRPDYAVELATDRTDITALRLELFSDDKANDNTSPDSRFILTDFKLEAMSGNRIEWEPVRIASAIAGSAQKGHPAAAAIDNKRGTGWAVAANGKPEHRQAAFIFAEPVPGGPNTRFRVVLRQESKEPSRAIQRFRLALSSVPKPALTPNGLPDEIAAGLRLPPSERSATQQSALAKYYLDTAPEYAAAVAKVESAKQAKADYIKQIPTTLATVTTEPRTIRILPRGNWMDDSGEIVQPALPEFLAPHMASGETRLNRLDLAKWLVSTENPLAARAFANRLWEIYFGIGISRVLDDLGAQGEWPKHPALLDWLAAELVESGWNVKHLVKAIVMSNTYRQSSNSSDLLRERDPYNRLLARQSRFRLEAELVRDNALEISGLLARTVGGPSVKPYQPDGYWQHLNFPKRTYIHDEGEAGYRRGLYTFWCRTFLHPSLLAFDAPGREECTANRVTSNNPLQALVLLNDPTYVEAARVFAERTLRACSGDISDQIAWIFSRALNRAPTSRETELLTELYRQQHAKFESDPQAAKDLIATGEWPVPNDIGPVQLAAMTSVCRTVLNLHETITRF